MSTPPPYGQPGYPDAGYGQPAYGTGVAPKSKTTAALLAFFLGGLGIHNFYRGQKGRGFGHLVLSLIFVIGYIIAIVTAVNTASTGQMTDSAAAGLGLGGLIAGLAGTANGIWTLVEFIMILVNKDGTLQ